MTALSATEFVDIRNGFAANLAALNADDDWIGVSPYAVPDPGGRVPIIMVWGLDDDEETTFAHGTAELIVIIRAVTGTMTEVAPQENIDRLLTGDLNIPGIIAADPTLGNKVAEAFVLGSSGHREFVQGASRLFGAEWRVRVTLST